MYRDDKLNEVLERFPHMYNIDIDSNNEFLISSIYEEIKELNKAVYDLAGMLGIEKATGIWLDKIGSVFSIYRETQEMDNNYRIRIMSYWLTVSRNATIDIMIKFLILAIESEDNLFKYEKGSGVIYIVLNKKLKVEIRETIERTLLEIKAAGVNIVIDFKYKIQKGLLLCGLFSAWNPHLWKYEEELVDKLNQVKAEETGLTKLNIHSVFQR